MRTGSQSWASSLAPSIEMTFGTSKGPGERKCVIKEIFQVGGGSCGAVYQRSSLFAADHFRDRSRTLRRVAAKRASTHMSQEMIQALSGQGCRVSTGSIRLNIP